MGMFDYVRCDYPVTPEINQHECQTKDMDEFGGTMSHYYIDPSGHVWLIDYRGTTEWVRDPTKPKPWPYVRLQPGKKGKVTPVYITDYVSIYPSNSGSSIWGPIARLHIVNGRVQSFTLTRRDDNVRRIVTGKHNQ